MTNIRCRQSGFAMVTAIFLMALVAMALTAASVATVGQARRTAMLGDDAQLRQLLIAGEAFAREHASTDGKFSVPLPDSLQDRAAALTVNIVSTDAASQKEAEIEASLGRHRLSQHIHLSLESGNWGLTRANLGE